VAVAAELRHRVATVRRRVLAVNKERGREAALGIGVGDHAVLIVADRAANSVNRYGGATGGEGGQRIRGCASDSRARTQAPCIAIGAERAALDRPVVPEGTGIIDKELGGGGPGHGNRGGGDAASAVPVMPAAATNGGIGAYRVLIGVVSSGITGRSAEERRSMPADDGKLLNGRPSHHANLGGSTVVATQAH